MKRLPPGDGMKPCEGGRELSKDEELENLRRAFDAAPLSEWDRAAGGRRLVVQRIELIVFGASVCCEVTVRADTAEEACDAIMASLRYRLDPISNKRPSRLESTRVLP